MAKAGQQQSSLLRELASGWCLTRLNQAISYSLASSLKDVLRACAFSFGMNEKAT